MADEAFRAGRRGRMAARPVCRAWRRTWLLQAPPFEGLVDATLRGAKADVIRWERSLEDSRGHRYVVVIRVDPARLDRFFDASSGYRAQFLAEPGLGHQADRSMLDTALHELAPHLASRYGPVSPRKRVEASIAHPRSRGWIQQGPWLRHARGADRVLRVAAWMRGLESADRDRRKKARWGMLAPHTESPLLLKGACFHEGRPLEVGEATTDRARDLHELGFT